MAGTAWRLAFGVLLLTAAYVRAGDDDDEDDDDHHGGDSSSGGSSSSGSSSSGDGCEWTAPGSSRTYDLSDMVRSGTNPDNDWKAEEDIQGFKFDYYFNICGDSIKGCNNHHTSASQYQIFGGTSAGCIPLGEAWSEKGKENTEWSEFGKPESDPKSSGVIIKYKNGQVCSTGGEKFSLAIKIPCGDTARKPGEKNDGLDPKKFVVEQDSASGCEYTISFPPITDGCPGSGRSSNWGTYFLVGLFLTVTCYVGGGVAFRVKKLGHTGKDALPHLEFWESVPGLVMDGIKFTIDEGKIAFEKFQSWRANR